RLEYSPEGYRRGPWVSSHTPLLDRNTGFEHGQDLVAGSGLQFVHRGAQSNSPGSPRRTLSVVCCALIGLARIRCLYAGLHLCRILAVDGDGSVRVAM